MNEDTQTRLAEIAERTGAAAAGPWEQAYNASNHKPADIFAPNAPNGYAMTVRDPGDGQSWTQWHDGSGEFVMHARTDIPYLLSAVAALSERLEEQAREIERLRTLLLGITRLGPPAKTGGFYYVCCSGSHNVHKDDCPWLLAKQALEAQAPTGAGGSEEGS